MKPPKPMKPESLKLRALLLKYIKLNKEVESNGGRYIEDLNPFLEPFYRELIETENKILKKFGLCTTLYHRSTLFKLLTVKQINSVVKELKIKAERYLSAKPQPDIEVLEAGKLFNFGSYQVLPEVGIKDTYYGMFFYEECFKKDKINALELITILKTIDDTDTFNTDYLHWYLRLDENIKRTIAVIDKLENKGIKYLEVLADYKPIYPFGFVTSDCMRLQVLYAKL